MLALGIFPQPCLSTGCRFAASRSRSNYYRRIGSFPQNPIRWNAPWTIFHSKSAFVWEILDKQSQVFNENSQTQPCLNGQRKALHHYEETLGEQDFKFRLSLPLFLSLSLKSVSRTLVLSLFHSPTSFPPISSLWTNREAEVLKLRLEGLNGSQRNLTAGLNGSHRNLTGSQRNLFD